MIGFVSRWNKADTVSRIRDSFVYRNGVSAAKSTWKAVDMTARGNLISMPLVAFSAAHAQRGETLSVIATEAVGTATYSAFSGAIALGLSLIPGGSLMSPAARATAATMAAMIPNNWLMQNMNRGFNQLSQTERRVRRIHMGGDFLDSSAAQSMRLQAVRDLTGAFSASRRFLGAEARFLG